MTVRHLAMPQNSFRLRIFCLLVASSLLIGSCSAVETPKCKYETITPSGFNPWDLWNLFADSFNFDASTVQGRVGTARSNPSSGSGYPSYIEDSEINTSPQSAGKNWAFTSNGGVKLIRTVVNGGLEAKESIKLESATVNGEVISTASSVTLDTAQVSGAVKYATTLEGDAFPNSQKVTGATLSIGDMPAVMKYFTDLSAEYALMPTSVLKWSLSAEGVLSVKLRNRVNVLTEEELNLKNWDKVKKIVLSGVANAVLIVNLIGDGSYDIVEFPNIEVVFERFGTESPPTFNRVLLNLPGVSGDVRFGPESYGFGGAHLRTHAKANQTTVAAAETARKAEMSSHGKRGMKMASSEKPVLSFSVLSAKAWVSIGGCILKGNVIAPCIGMINAEIHNQPWGKVVSGGGLSSPRAPRGPNFVSARCLWGQI